MLGQSFRMAFSAIASNKMRSFLTMLGVIIGIMAVVVLVSIVNSATAEVTSQLASLGADKLSVNIISDRYQPLKPEDLLQLEDEIEDISMVAPSSAMSATVKAGEKSTSAIITGTTPAYSYIEGLGVSLGRFIKSPDVDNYSSVGVIGPKLAKELFGDTNVLGENVSVNGRTFLIVGVLEESGSMLATTDNGIVVPFTVAQRMSGSRGVRSFTAIATNSETVDRAEINLTEWLTRFFSDDDEAFSVLNQGVILQSLDSITTTLSLMLGGIAAISLLVGGIGIMNIMLVSVAERTKEIGIRKAIGASRKRILLQFLIESLVLSTLGGLIGIVVSWGALQLVSFVMDSSYTMTPSIALIAVAFSLAIGLIFGLSPANKAAKMTPIEALRTD